jgi:hypothetical protein
MRTSETRRAALAAFLLSLGACGSNEAADPGDAAAGEAPAAEAVATQTIECALEGAESFAAECTVERQGEGVGAILVVRHPDGGFRRFEVLADQRGLGPADGAAVSRMEWREGGIGLAVGSDRYRFPAAVLGDAAR